MAACGRASPYPIEGVVKDYETGEPIPNVPVVLRVRGSDPMAGLPHVPSSMCLFSAVTMADENGQFSFPGIDKKIFWWKKNVGWRVAAYKRDYMNVRKLIKNDSRTGLPYYVSMSSMKPSVETLLLKDNSSERERVSYLKGIAMRYGRCSSDNNNYNELFVSQIYKELMLLVDDGERGYRDIKYLCHNGTLPRLKFDPETRTCIGLMNDSIGSY